MNTRLALCAALLFALCGCGKKEPPAPAADPGTTAQTMLGRVVDKAMENARKELHAKNVHLDGSATIGGVRIGGEDGDSPLRKGEITPQGDFLVAGKQVAIDDGQRELLLAYRGELIAIAETGMALGVRGADMAGKALGETLGGILRGEGKRFKEAMEAQGKRLEDEARRLCERLPRMLDIQQQLVANLPEFRPYARMTQEDIDRCFRDDGEAEAEGE